MNSAVIHEISEKSLAGKITFPEVVRQLLESGIESYRVDLVQNQKTFYSQDGEAYTKNFDFKGPAIAPEFSTAKTVAAIRASQTGQINYTEFLNQVMQAGVSSYTACLTGRKVVYMGRKGDSHVEHFPK